MADARSRQSLQEGLLEAQNAPDDDPRFEGFTKQEVIEDMQRRIDESFQTELPTFIELSRARQDAQAQGVGQEVLDQLDLQISEAGQREQGERLENGAARARIVGQGATFRLGDEIEGFIRMAVERNPELENVEEFRMFRDQARESIKKFTEENPVEAIALEVAGAAAVAGPIGAGRVAAARTLPALARQTAGRTAGEGLRRGAAVGGGVGAVEGFGGSEADLTQGDFVGTFIDTAVGGGAGVVFGGALGALVGRSVRNKELERILTSGQTDASAAGVRLADDSQSAFSKVVNAIRRGSARLVNDPQAKEAIRQGFDPGVISMASGASRVDRTIFRQMANIFRRGRRDPEFAARNRATDIPGRSLTKRYNAVNDARKQAGKDLDVVAKRLAGQKIDVNTQLDGLIKQLDDSLGVKIGADGKPIFTDSAIEGLTSLENPIKTLVNRINRFKAQGGQVDAQSIHRLKRFIDENVTFGKSGANAGLSGTTDNLFKGFRKELKDVLDNNFDFYKEANKKYSTLVEAKNNFDSAMGASIRRTTDGDPSAAIGTNIRGILSNRQTRGEMQKSIDLLDSVANELTGQKFTDNVTQQIIFANELEDVFGSAAKTGFSSEVAKGTRQAAAEGVAEVAGQVITGGGGPVRAIGREIAEFGRAITGRQINEENALQAIRRFLTSR